MELKSLLIRVKEKSEKVGLKHNIKKSKITASSSITSWQIKGEKLEVMMMAFEAFSLHATTIYKTEQRAKNKQKGNKQTRN